MTTEAGGGWQWKLALLVGVGAFALFAWTGRTRFAPLDLGSRAPRYAAATMAGDSLHLDDLRGHVVLVNIWATWCPPCVREMPALQRLFEKYRERGLRVVAVNVDNAMFGADPVALVRAFVSQNRLTFDVVLDPENRIEAVFQVPALPMTFVIDERGRIRQKVLGGRDWDAEAMQVEIRALLEN
jgi:peroxiredoxin